MLVNLLTGESEARR